MLRTTLALTLLCAFAADHALAYRVPPSRNGRKTAGKSVRKKARKPVVTFDVDAVNNPDTRDKVGPKAAGSAALRAQILLDRAHFSVGEITGEYEPHMKNAVSYFQQAHGMGVDAIVQGPVWDALNADTAPALQPYTITAEDLKGPFEKLPKGMEELAKLKAVGYETTLEMFGERFHSSPALLKKLNPRKSFDKEGEEIMVPNVTRTQLSRADHVVVNGADLTVTALDANGKVIAAYPASAGTEHDPLPVGDWKVNGRSYNPQFHYNPALFWDAKPGDVKQTIPPGPNNPVGLVWIDLSKEHYGIHGTPEPGNISKTQSHGCIRLTNWDATELAGMVAPGTRVIIKQ